MKKGNKIKKKIRKKRIILVSVIVLFLIIIFFAIFSQKNLNGYTSSVIQNDPNVQQIINQGDVRMNSLQEYFISCT